MDRQEYKRQNEEREAKIKDQFVWRKFWYWRPRWWKPPSDRFAAIVALFTAVLAIVSSCQWHEMKLAYPPLKDSADAAKKSAKAAQNAVELADKTAARQLRAYVWVKMNSVKYPPKPKKADRIGIGFKMTNSGQTWAQNHIIQTAIIPRNFDVKYDPWDRAQWNISSPMVFGPHQSESFQLDNIWLRDIQNFLPEKQGADKRGVDYAIWITYEDTLAQPPIIRQTQLCQRFAADKDGGRSFSYLPTHNCADDDCPKEK